MSDSDVLLHSSSRSSDVSLLTSSNGGSDDLLAGVSDESEGMQDASILSDGDGDFALEDEDPEGSAACSPPSTYELGVF